MDRQVNHFVTKPSISPSEALAEAYSRYCCSNFGLIFERFVNGDISMSNKVFVKSFYSSVSESDWLTVDALRQVMNLRDGFDFLFFSDGSTLSDYELDSLILYLASSRTL